MCVGISDKVRLGTLKKRDQRKQTSAFRLESLCEATDSQIIVLPFLGVESDGAWRNAGL